MAGSSEIKYTVNVDSSRANRGLTQFSRAAQQAGRDAVMALDDTATAGEQARAAIEAMAQAMETEMKDAATAAEALAQALGPELAAKMDPAAIVADLNKMGVSFDEIRGDADKFATSLKQITQLDLAPTTGEIDTMDAHLQSANTHTGDLSGSARGANSALANMIGNTTQDLGAFAGVAGSAGVAIGQIGEYAADASLGGESLGQSLGNMAKVAGPMAALAGAMAVVQYVMAGIAKEKAFNAEQVEKYAAVIEEVGAGTSAIRETLSEVNKFQFAAGSGILGFGTSIVDITDILDKYGITVSELAPVIAGTNAETQDYIATLQASGVHGNDLIKITAAIKSQQEAYNSALERGAQVSTVYAASAGDITGAMSANSVALGGAEVKWERLLKDLKDGHIDTQNATKAWNDLRLELGLSEKEMAALVQTKLDERLEADKQAATELGDAIANAAQQIGDYNRTVSSADFGAAALEGATTAAEGFFDTVLVEESQIADSQAAFDDLAESVDGLGTTFMDLNSPEGRAAFGNLQKLGATIVPKVAQAFDEADGDLDHFKSNMHIVGEQTIVGLIGSFKDLGYSTDQARDMANDLMIQLGLIPENVETLYNLAGTEEAKLKLGLLQGAIDKLPKNVQTQVTQHIITGDYVGALAVVQNYYDNNPASLKVQPVIDWDAVAREKSKLQSAFSSIKVTVQPRSSSAAAAAEPVATSRGATAAPMVAATPVTVNVHTAVMGNRYDVERFIARAVRSGVRIAGQRQLSSVR